MQLENEPQARHSLPEQGIPDLQQTCIFIMVVKTHAFTQTAHQFRSNITYTYEYFQPLWDDLR